MKKKSEKPKLKLHKGKPLFCDCKTREDVLEAFREAYHTESCRFDDVNETIKDFMVENGHFLTPEVKALQRLRDRLGRNIHKIIYTKDKILQRRKQC